MKKPCANCPFRSDVKPFLHPARAVEIANADSFVCHKTLGPADDEGDGTIVSSSQECAGWQMLNGMLPKADNVYANKARMATAYRKEWNK